jgi:hypothetical protein
MLVQSSQQFTSMYNYVSIATSSRFWQMWVTGLHRLRYGRIDVVDQFDGGFCARLSPGTKTHHRRANCRCRQRMSKEKPKLCQRAA